MDARPILHPTDQTLSSFGLGKLDDRSAEAVSNHLEQCPNCPQRVAELSADRFLGRIQDAQPMGEHAFSQSRTSATGGQTGQKILAPAPANTLPPGLADHPDHEIKRELGRGGMGVVYLAHKHRRPSTSRPGFRPRRRACTAGDDDVPSLATRSFAAGQGWGRDVAWVAARVAEGDCWRSGYRQVSRQPVRFG